MAAEGGLCPFTGLPVNQKLSRQQTTCLLNLCHFLPRFLLHQSCHDRLCLSRVAVVKFFGGFFEGLDILLYEECFLYSLSIRTDWLRRTLNLSTKLLFIYQYLFWPDFPCFQWLSAPLFNRYEFDSLLLLLDYLRWFDVTIRTKATAPSRVPTFPTNRRALIENRRN